MVFANSAVFKDTKYISDRYMSSGGKSASRSIFVQLWSNFDSNWEQSKIIFKVNYQQRPVGWYQQSIEQLNSKMINVGKNATDWLVAGVKLLIRVS